MEYGLPVLYLVHYGNKYMKLSRLQKSIILFVVVILLCIPWISYTVWSGDVGYEDNVSVIGLIRHIIFDSQRGPVGPPLPF
jgi:hypothetical protein